MNSLYEVVAQTRVKHKDLAEHCGVSVVRVRNWIYGNTTPTPEERYLIADLLGPEAIVSWLDETPTLDETWKAYLALKDLDIATCFPGSKMLPRCRFLVGLSLKEIAAIFHVGDKTWRSWELGTKQVPDAYVTLIQDAFGQVEFPAYIRSKRAAETIVDMEAVKNAIEAAKQDPDYYLSAPIPDSSETTLDDGEYFSDDEDY